MGTPDTTLRLRPKMFEASLRGAANGQSMGGRAMKYEVMAAAVAVAALCAGASSQVQAQSFPVRPVTLIVPWAAGGTTDIGLRALASATEKHLGQSIVVENRPGGSGTLGPAQMAATAKPDGYTVAQIPITVFRFPFMTKTTFDP